MDSSFTKVAVQVPRLSGFDKSHQNLLTSKVGTITPILIDELIPGSKVHLNLALSAQLPPLASDTFMRCSIKTEAFFVPFRLLAGSFESWFTDQAVSFQGSFGAVTSFVDKVGYLPCLGNFAQNTVTVGSTTKTITEWFESVGSLGDYLGMKSNPISSTSGGTTTITGMTTSGVVSALSWLCYHRVYDDWYRNTLVQRPVFVRPQAGSAGGSAPYSHTICAGTSPFYFFSQYQTSSTPNYIFDSADSLKLADGKYLFELRQRNFGADYFTTATPRPQLGSAMTVSFGTDPNGAGSSTSFSIAALRAANSLQQFAERNQLSGVRYQDMIRQRYGANLSSGVAQRSLFLGGAEFEVYTKGIYQNGQAYDSNAADSWNDSSNPFAITPGAQFGSAQAAGKSLNISFEANEPGFLLVNATLVPRVTYSSGVNRRLLHYVGAGSITDMANPILQNVGPQPIYAYELGGYNGSLTSNVFGYTDRYAEFKTMEDELHGIVRDGQTLQSFALQRNFSTGSTPQISTSFLQIPTDYMDNVTAVSSQISIYGYWLDCYFDYKVAQPLAKYSLPSLQDPAYEHGKTIVLDKGGFHIH